MRISQIIIIVTVTFTYIYSENVEETNNSCPFVKDSDCMAYNDYLINLTLTENWVKTNQKTKNEQNSDIKQRAPF